MRHLYSVGVLFSSLINCCVKVECERLVVLAKTPSYTRGWGPIPSPPEKSRVFLIHTSYLAIYTEHADKQYRCNTVGK